MTSGANAVAVLRRWEMRSREMKTPRTAPDGFQDSVRTWLRSAADLQNQLAQDTRCASTSRNTLTMSMAVLTWYALPLVTEES